MALKFSKRVKVITSSVLILSLATIGLYVIFYKPNICLSDKTIRTISANEKTKLDIQAQIQEETFKSYILDKDLSLINVYRKACFGDTQKPWQYEAFSALKYKDKIIGEFSFLTQDNSKLDNLKNSPVYGISDENKTGQRIKLVRYTDNIAFNDQENIYLLKFTTKSGLNENSIIGYEWESVNNLEWESSDNGKNWSYQS